MFGIDQAELVRMFTYYDNHCDKDLTLKVRSLIPQFNHGFPSDPTLNTLWIDGIHTGGFLSSRIQEKMNAIGLTESDQILKYRTENGRLTTIGYIILRDDDFIQVETGRMLS